MNKFLTLETAWETFKEQSDIVQVTDGDEMQLQAAKDLFFAGAQGALFALAHIKEYVNDDPRQAVPLIMAMYGEAAKYINEANARADEYDRQQKREQQEREQRAAWPFPTGVKH